MPLDLKSLRSQFDDTKIVNDLGKTLNIDVDSVRRAYPKLTDAQILDQIAPAYDSLSASNSAQKQPEAIAPKASHNKDAIPVVSRDTPAAKPWLAGAQNMIDQSSGLTGPSTGLGIVTDYDVRRQQKVEDSKKTLKEKSFRAASEEVSGFDKREDAKRTAIGDGVQQVKDDQARAKRREGRPGIGRQILNDTSRGVDNLANLGTGLTALADDAMGFDALAEEGLREYVLETDRIAAENPAVIGSYKNVDSLGDAGRYATEAVFENLAMFIPSLVSGGIGATVARKGAEKLVAGMVAKQVAGGASKEAAEKAAAIFVQRQVTKGSIAGAMPASVGMESGSIYGDIYQETGKREAGIAAGAGLAAGALDMIEPVLVLRKALGPVADEVAQGVFKRYGKEVGTQMLTEGGTEFAQTLIESGAVSYVDGKPLLSEENLDKALEGMLKGGVAGGVMGGVSQAVADGRAPQSTPANESVVAPTVAPASGPAGGLTPPVTDPISGATPDPISGAATTPEATVTASVVQAPASIPSEAELQADADALSARSQEKAALADEARAMGNLEMADQLEGESQTAAAAAKQALDTIEVEHTGLTGIANRTGIADAPSALALSAAELANGQLDTGNRAALGLDQLRDDEELQPIATPVAEAPAIPTPAQFDSSNPIADMTAANDMNLRKRAAYVRSSIRASSDEKFKAAAKAELKALTAEIDGRNASPADPATVSPDSVPAPAKAEASPFSVEFGGRRFPVPSVKAASELWTKFRDETGAGASEIGNGVPVFDATGKQVARISYNGRAWEGEPAVGGQSKEIMLDGRAERVNALGKDNADTIEVDGKTQTAVSQPGGTGAGIEAQEFSSKDLATQAIASASLVDTHEVVRTGKTRFVVMKKITGATQNATDIITTHAVVIEGKPGTIKINRLKSDPKVVDGVRFYLDGTDNGLPVMNLSKQGTITDTKLLDSFVESGFIDHNPLASASVPVTPAAAPKTGTSPTGLRYPNRKLGFEVARIEDGGEPSAWANIALANLQPDDKVTVNGVTMTVKSIGAKAVTFTKPDGKTTRFDVDTPRMEQLVRDVADLLGASHHSSHGRDWVSVLSRDPTFGRTGGVINLQDRGTEATASVDAMNLAARHARLNRAIDQLSDTEVHALYRKMGLAGELLNVDKKREALKQEHPDDTEAAMKAKPEAAKPEVSDNTVFTEDAAEKAREVLRQALRGTQLNTGLDPKVLQAALTLSGYHVERGARTFAAYSQAMIKDLGDGVRPYLKSFYMALKYDPKAAGIAEGMSSEAEVNAEPRTEDRRQSDEAVADGRRRGPRRVDDMTPEEMRQALLINPLTDLPNKRAFEEDADLGWPHVAAMDIDGFGFLNDIWGHDPVDAILKQIGAKMAGFSTDTVRLYHRSGDEFAARSNDKEALQLVLKSLQDHLEASTFTVDGVGEDGRPLKFIKHGIGVTFGISTDYQRADNEANADKERRLAAGQRGAKGTNPGGMVEVDAEGVQADLGKRGLSRQETERLRNRGSEGGLAPEQEAANKDAPVSQVVLQNRNRSDAAYVQQMTQISANPDATRLGFSRDFSAGAPVILADGIPANQMGKVDRAATGAGRQIKVQYAVVEANDLLASNAVDGTKVPGYDTGVPGKSRAVAGNGRVAGIKSAYQKGTAGQYREDIAGDEALHGVSASVIRGMKAPILVRIMSPADVTANIGDESNDSGVSQKSAIEHAKDDARRIDVAGLEFGEDGEVTKATMRQFVASMPVSEQTGMLTAGGEPTTQATNRLMGAIFWQAYQSEGLTELFSQATDPEARTVLQGLAIAAPAMARLKDIAGHDLDIRDLITEAAVAAVNARRRNIKLSEYVNQLDLDASPEIAPILRMFGENIRSSKKIGESLQVAAEFAYDEATRDTSGGMFGDAVPRATRNDVLGKIHDTARQENLGQQGRAGADGGDAQGQAANTRAEGGRAEAEGNQQERLSAPDSRDTEWLTSLAQTLLRNGQTTERDFVSDDGQEYTVKATESTGRLTTAQYDGWKRAVGLARSAMPVNEELLNVSITLTGRNAGEGRDYRAIRTEYVPKADQEQSRASLIARYRQAAPMSAEWSELLDKITDMTISEAKRDIDAGTPVAFSTGNGTFVTITPSAQQPGMIQVTMYNQRGIFGDSQYADMESAVRDHNLRTASRISGAELDAALGESLNSERQYQAARQQATLTQQNEARGRVIVARMTAIAEANDDRSDRAARLIDDINDKLVTMDEAEARATAIESDSDNGSSSRLFDRWISLAADSIERLRASDVGRVLEQAQSPDSLKAAAEYLSRKRPDLRGTIGRDADAIAEENGWTLAGFSLTTQTEAELAAQNAAIEEDAARRRMDDIAAEQKYEADRDRDQFLLTGSNRASDANPNQNDMFGASSRSSAVEEAPKANKPATGQVADAGDSLHWNRKNPWRGGGLKWDDVADKNVTLRMAMAVKSKIWAKPDWEEYLAEVPDNLRDAVTLAARMVKQVYDAIAAKPRTEAGIKDYIESVTKARDAAEAFLKDTDAVREFALAMADKAQARLARRVSILDVIGSTSSTDKKKSQPIFAAMFPESIGQRRFAESEEGMARAIGRKAVSAMQFDIPEVVKAMKDISDNGWPSKREAWQVRGYSVVERNGVFVLRHKPGSSRFTRDISEHGSEAEAIEAARALVARPQSETEPRPEAIALDRLTRTGPPRRQAGENVTPQDLIDTFGFRGVNFGNYVPNDERQAHVNNAFDSMLDLAEALNLPPAAMSLGGMLGLAFGAQGNGGKNGAHFVPGVNEINLTRKSGAGALAHEWAHAVDHYFGVLGGLATAKEPFASWLHMFRRTGESSIRPEVKSAFESIVNAMQKSKETIGDARNRIESYRVTSKHNLDAHIARYALDDKVAGNAEATAALEQIKNGEPGEYVEKPRRPRQRRAEATNANVLAVAQAASLDNVDLELLAQAARSYSFAMKEAVDEANLRTVHTEFYRSSRSTDRDERRDYWATNHEMFARAFEAYVLDKLASKEARNDYLVSASTAEEAVAKRETKVYPIGADRKAIASAFDALFGIVETAEENGRLIVREGRPAYDSGNAKSGFDNERKASSLQVESQRRSSSPEEQGTLDLFAPSGVPAETAREQSADNFLVHYVHEPVGRLSTGFTQIKTPEQAAHLFAPNRRHAQETIMAAVLDKDDNILHVIRHSKGLKDAASASPVELVAGIAATKGAAKVWISHNHPSGIASPSGADYNITRLINSALDGTGIELAGHIVVGEGRQAHYFKDSLDGRGILVEPAIRNREASVTERIQRKRIKGEELGSPSLARQFAKKLEARDAVILLNTQHRVVGTLAMSPREMSFLRDGKQVNRLLSAIDKANVAAIIVKASNTEAATNLARFINNLEGLRLLDVLYEDSGFLRSDAERGTGIAESRGEFYSRSEQWYFSPLTRAVEGMKQETALASQWRAMIEKAPGVKSDELEATGVIEWLQAAGGKVKKADILDFLADKAVIVRDVMKGGESDRNAEIKRAFNAAGYDIEVDTLREEIEYTDSDGEPVEYDDLPQALQDVVNANVDADGAKGATVYGKYTVPGGKNYREMLITLPSNIDSNGKKYAVGFSESGSYVPFNTRAEADAYNQQVYKGGAKVFEIDRGGDARSHNSDKHYQSSHWNEANILAHVRFDERTDADGKRVLFINEIQSDWGQEGKKKGIAGTVEAALKVNGITRAEFDAMDSEDQQFAIEETKRMGLPPAAPFVTKTDAWVSLAIKRMIRHAAENGFDRVAFINGQQAADLYDLSKQIDSIEVGRLADGDYAIRAHDKKGNIVDGFRNKRVKESELADYVGKELADKIVANEGGKFDSRTNSRTYSGVDLKVGGEGMKTFYDKIVPKVAQDVIKKLGGGKVVQVSMRAPMDGDMDFRIEANDDMLERGTFVILNNKGKPHPGIGRKPFNSREEAQSTLRDLAKPVSVQTGFDITPAMRDTALAGLPLFSVGKGKGSLTAASLEKQLRDGPAGTAIGKMLDDGKIVIHNTVPAGRDATAQGWTTKSDGTIHLVANRLTTRTVVPTLFHELFHRGMRLITGTASHKRLMKELEAIYKHYRSAPAGSATNKFWIEAMRRTDAANTTTADMVEEFGAYAVTAFEAAPRSLRKWVAEFVGHVKAWLLRTTGMQLGGVTPGQMRAIAVHALRAETSGRAAPVPDDAASVNYSKANTATVGDTYKLPPARWFITQVFDRFDRLDQVQKAVTEQGGSVTDLSDVYGQEEAYHSRAASAIDRFRRHRVGSLFKRMVKAGIAIEDVGLYLYAQHAPERNAQIAKLYQNGGQLNLTGMGNQHMQDGGSGMTNKEAADHMAEFQQRGIARKLDTFARELRDITKDSREILRNSGLEASAAIDAWEAAYQFYVPLSGKDEANDASSVIVGRGFDVRGGQKRAMGRKDMAKHVIEQIIIQHEQAVIRAEKNLVGKRLLQFVRDNPDDKLWQVNPVEQRRYIDAKGNAEYRNQPLRTDRNVVSVRINGKDTFILLADQGMADAIHNVGTEDVGFLLRALGVVSRFTSKMFTAFSPAFIAVNALRDFQTAMLHGYQVGGIKYSANIVKNIPGALAELVRDVRKGDSKLVKLYEQSGGRTGMVYMIKDFEEKHNEVMHQMAALKGVSLAEIMQAFEAGYKEGFQAVGRKARYNKFTGVFDALVESVETVNGVMENMTRLAAFKAAIDEGKSAKEAGSIAKNLTVNFNRKGELAPTLGSLYIFFNASVQGTVRMAEALKNPKLQAVAVGMVLLSAALAAMQMGDDDDKDEDGRPDFEQIPAYQRSRNLIFMHDDGSHTKIPLPLGWNVFHSFGTELAVMARSKSREAYGTGAWNILKGTVEMFNPVGDLTPSVAAPFLQIANNESHFGGPIYPEYKDKLPNSQQFYDGTEGSVYERATTMANEVTGGNEYRPGMVDVNPEKLQHVVEFFGGGALRFLTDTADAVTAAADGGPLQPVDKLPIARAFVGRLRDEYQTSRYYENVGKVEAIAAEIKGLEESGKFDEMAAVAEKNPMTDSLSAEIRITKKALKQLKQHEREVRADEDLSEGELRQALQDIREERGQIVKPFNSMYEDAMRKGQ